MIPEEAGWPYLNNLVSLVWFGRVDYERKMLQIDQYNVSTHQLHMSLFRTTLSVEPTANLLYNIHLQSTFRHTTATRRR